MKLDTSDVVLHQRGVQASSQYQIAQSAKMMKMLADTLYQDKKKAPIRELTTNAWDAHVMAGNIDKVPVIHLPVHHDPEWRIRDFGTGMSPEDLMEMYQTYGESNKSESNDYNGCMGIGSKSPFAYSSSFTTTSYWNGMKYIYINAKDEDGIPTIYLFHSEETDEPNGLQISFAVKPEDFVDFRNKTLEVLSWFPKMFIVENLVAFQASHQLKRKYVMQGEGWKIRSDTNESCAIMGYVEYPIEHSYFSSNESHIHRSNDWYKHYDRTPLIRLLNLGLELHFNIGEVEMDISREGLQYNTQTIKAIKFRLEKVLNEIKEKVEEKFKSCDCLWDARMLMQNLIHGELHNIRDLISVAQIEFEGRRLYDAAVTSSGLLSVSSSEEFNVTFFENRRRKNKVLDIGIREQIQFWLADMERGNYAAINRLLDENEGRGTIYLIKPNSGYTVEQARKAFIKLCGMKDEHVKLCSTVPKSTKQKSKSKVVNVFTFDQTQINHSHPSSGKAWQRKLWKNSVVNFREGGIYVEVNAWQVKQIGVWDKVSSTKIVDIAKALKALDIIVPEIIGVKTNVVSKYDKSIKWTNFFDWAKAKLEAHIKQTNIFQHLSDIEALNAIGGDGEKLNSIVKNSTEKIEDSENLILISLDKIKSFGKIKEEWGHKLKEVQLACNLLGIDQPETQEGSRLVSLIKQVNEKYEVLDLIDSWDARRERVATKVVRIINLVDSCSKDKD